jgi:hypothetical protein
MGFLFEEVKTIVCLDSFELKLSYTFTIMQRGSMHPLSSGNSVVGRYEWSLRRFFDSSRSSLLFKSARSS